MARERIKTKKPIAAVKPQALDKVDKVLDLYGSGFNINQIASMLQLHSQFVKETIAKYNENV